LTIWEAAGAIGAGDRAGWERAARRIAAGLRELAHLEPTIDRDLLVLAVPVGTAGAAARWSLAIASENVEARVVVDGAGVAGVRLPCRPDAPDEEIRHVVLACVKAAHAAAPAPAVAANLDAMFRAERIVADVSARLRTLGGGLGHGLRRGARLP
jgi:hypothetical protein